MINLTANDLQLFVVQHLNCTADIFLLCYLVPLCQWHIQWAKVEHKTQSSSKYSRRKRKLLWIVASGLTDRLISSFKLNAFPKDWEGRILLYDNVKDFGWKHLVCHSNQSETWTLDKIIDLKKCDSIGYCQRLVSSLELWCRYFIVNEI